MLDKILAFGTVFDWISPLIAGFRDVVDGPSHTFLIYENCGWSVREIARLLRRHGVKTWGHMIVNHNIMITVRQQQARWAQYLLEREDIPIQYGLIGDPNAQPPRPTHKVKHPDPLEEVSSWFDELADSLGL